MATNYFGYSEGDHLESGLDDTGFPDEADYDVAAFHWELESHWREIGEILQRHIPRPVQSLEDKITTPSKKGRSSSRRLGVKKHSTAAPGRLAVVLLGIVLCFVLGAIVGRRTSLVSPDYYVRFSWTDVSARSVAVSGDFNQWDRTELEKDPVTGVWQTWVAVPEGRHRYVFVLDGNRRVADPMALERASDGSGGEVSILYIPYKGR